ncbi:MAG: glycosyltransferase family 2 protein [Bacteroidota bacterium]|nr:glycosyltransferase family 2 protein [Bacteroidota bacterium]
MDTPITLGIILPCYNEEEIISSSFSNISQYMASLISQNKISNDSFLVFVDDGSKDKTIDILQEIKKSNSHVKIIKLSRNFGHQYAILAGLSTFYTKADCLITIDADLQDDISVIGQMVEKYHKGNELVYGVRLKRDTDSFFKKTTAIVFYKLMHWMGVDIVFNHADYRLASKKALEELLKYDETNLFLRGIFPTLGFKTDTVYYNRMERTAGVSKYPFMKMLSFAFDGITSFSVRPLRLVTFAGVVIFIGTILLTIYAILGYFFYNAVHGWTSIVLPIYFLGGVQLLGIGILGEYIGKIYKEVKRRPRFIIEKLMD